MGNYTCGLGTLSPIENKQRVLIRGSYSEWSPLTAGVLQGSILGPIMFLIYSLMTLYHYPLKGRWIVGDIYRDAKRRGICPPLFTHPEGDSWLSIYQIRCPQFLLLKLSRNDASFFSPFAKQWMKDIPSYGSQSERAKIAIHWFGKY